MRKDLLTSNTKVVWYDESLNLIELENDYGVWWRMKLNEYLNFIFQS